VRDELMERLRDAATSKVADPLDETLCKTPLPPRVVEERETEAEELELRKSPPCRTPTVPEKPVAFATVRLPAPVLKRSEAPDKVPFNARPVVVENVAFCKIETFPRKPFPIIPPPFKTRFERVRFPDTTKLPDNSVAVPL